MSIKIRNWTEIWKQSILNLILNGLRHRPSWEREKDKTQKLAGMLLLQTTNQLGLCRKLLPYSKPQTPHLSEPPPLTLHVKGENESSGPSASSPDTTYRLLRVSPISLFRNMCVIQEQHASLKLKSTSGEGGHLGVKSWPSIGHSLNWPCLYVRQTESLIF